ncbi:MAG: hypothetical protein Q9221_008307 [Calogaya cf. arnoldii]
MSSLRLSFLGLLAVSGLAAAQSSVVNASDISIWPPCAQRKYAPPTLSNVHADPKTVPSQPLATPDNAMRMSVKGVAVSASTSASENINSAGAAAPTGVQGAVGGVSGSSNGSTTGAGGMNPPAPFTGAAGRLGQENLAVFVTAIVGAVGVVLMVRL